MKSLVLTAMFLITMWGAGCKNMEEKQTRNYEPMKATKGDSFTNLSEETKAALFERYFGKSLSEFENRKIYTELNPAIIETIPDDKLERAVHDFISAAIKDDWDHATTKIPALGPGFAAVYFVSWADVEVSNGGFNQFFFNHGRKAVELAREGAELMELPAVAAAISKALAIEEVEREKMAEVKKAGTIEALFESYDEISFDEADETFLNFDFDFEKEIVSFIRRRPDLFVGKVE